MNTAGIDNNNNISGSANTKCLIKNKIKYRYRHFHQLLIRGDTIIRISNTATVNSR